MAGRGPAMNESRQRVIKILPVRIVHQDQPDLLCTRIVLQVSLPLPCLSDIVMVLGIHEASQAISLRKAL